MSIRTQFASANTSYVGADDVAIGRMATAHLIGRGYRRIAHIARVARSSPVSAA